MRLHCRREDEASLFVLVRRPVRHSYTEGEFRLFPHLTTHQPMLYSASSLDLPVQVPMAYAIRKFCDIVRPPGGRL